MAEKIGFSLGAGEANRTPDPNLGKETFPLENPQLSWLFDGIGKRTDHEWDVNNRDHNPRIVPGRMSEFASPEIIEGGLSMGTALPRTVATRHRKNRKMSTYSFTRFTSDDLPMVAQWLETPEVSRWWGDSRAQISLIADDLSEPLMDQWLVEQDGKPFAYLQAYPARAWPQTHLADLPTSGKVVDVFVGVPTMIGCGHGRAFLRKFAEMLITQGASIVATDPLYENIRARRAYSRAGFREQKIVSSPDGLVAVMVFSSNQSLPAT